MKLTFSWSVSSDRAKPSQADVARLKSHHTCFQIDFLNDVISVAESLLADAIDDDRVEFQRKRNAAKTHTETS
jgi:hypothetical protein